MVAAKNKRGTIMFQGTASDVGKSLLATGLCRILAGEKRVSPFKSWNMSLNSYVTKEGGEIGIAQALQARAAGEDSITDMQPILVKPRGDGKSQVILKGRPIGDFKYTEDTADRKEYFKKANQVIRESLDGLRKIYDYIVMEGAGSPVEVNRKSQDLANMRVARIFNTPVILVANIDRGGALASIVGTLKLLEPEERKLVKGIIINKFRGDYDLLKPGLQFLEDYTDIPVVGVIPYLKDIKLPEEDSASLQNELSGIEENKLIIAIIKLPYMSNFTDFKSLEFEADVSLKYVNNVSEMDGADMIIIPGSKTTTKDLNYLKKSGIAEGIINKSGRGVLIIGICGGYQMLGRSLIDNYQTEGKIKKISGLGLLPIETSFLSVKSTYQVKAEINNQFPVLKGIKEDITGYEIHMGETNYLDQSDSLFIIKERSGKKVFIKDGAFNKEKNCFGTYLHGLFNNDNFRRGLLNNVRKNKGLDPLTYKKVSYNRNLDDELDKVADIIANNLNMEYIYELLDD